MIMTLRELCEISGTSRRAIQGYEAAGLVKASGKNKFGHLEYDEESQERVKTIRLYQRMGFTLKEIVHFIDKENAVIVKALEERLVQLYKNKSDLEEIIDITIDMINKLKN